MPIAHSRMRRAADSSLPFGGVPVGVKQLERVAGWPFTEGSLVFADRVAESPRR
jgi:Asp-tRNA(Asn)/Glu-tRNA(Gln) amidotransferase A subunit family amidase